MQQGRGQMPQPAGAPGQAPPEAGAPGAPGGPGGGGRGQQAPRPPVPPEFDADPIMKLDEPALIAILKDPKATEFQKAMACKKLATIGTAASIAPLAALLSVEHLNNYARFGLEPNPDPAVDAALREATGKLKGRLLMGVIHTIGVRRDAQAVEILGRLIYDSDPEVAQASASSLGMIANAASAKLLREALGKTKMPVFPVVARAALLCAESLLASDRKTAVAMYNELSAANMPKPVRQAAFRELMLLQT